MKTHIEQYVSIRSNKTPITGPRGQAPTGISVSRNLHTPNPKDMAAAPPATASIHSFVPGMIPGTMSIVTIKREKTSVVSSDKVQKIMDRALILALGRGLSLSECTFRLRLRTFIRTYYLQCKCRQPSYPCNASRGFPPAERKFASNGVLGNDQEIGRASVISPNATFEETGHV